MITTADRWSDFRYQNCNGKKKKSEMQTLRDFLVTLTGLVDEDPTVFIDGRIR